MLLIGYALAALVGLSLGLMGGGGSILTVPIFVYVLGYDPKLAIAMSLPVIGVTSLAGAVGHWRAGNVHLRTAISFGLIAMLGAYAGARAATLLTGAVQLAILALIMLAAAVMMFRSARRTPASTEGSAPALRAMPVSLLVPVALAVGVITGLVGIGGGFLVVPALVLLARAPMKQAVGTSLLVIAMNSVSGFAGYLGQVEVPWMFVVIFTTIAVGGILVGTWGTRFVSQRALKQGFAVFLILMGSFMLYRNRAVLTAAAPSHAGLSPAAMPHIIPGVLRMLLKRFYDTKLAQASYLIGCQKTGEAIVIDANRDIQQYLDAAAEEGVRVTHVSETHIHADFVSGSRELAQRAGAQLLLSDEGDADWKYAFAASSNAVLLHDRDVFMIGNLKFEVLHTPGHTPEHIVFVVTDTPASSQPIGVVTGDFVFVGDVGRPDLLEKAAKITGTMEAGARTLFRSLQQFKTLPDHLQIWPGHGAGSACGKALGAVPTSALGYEKIVNWGLRLDDEQSFVDAVLEGQPEPPKYFAEMKRINKIGPAILGTFSVPPTGDLAALRALLASGATVVDTRDATTYAAGFIPGTINIPFTRSFNTWAGWLLPYDADVHLIAEAESVPAMVRDLAMIGLDRVASVFSTTVVEAWQTKGHALDRIVQRSVTEVAAMQAEGTVTVLDVRGASEYAAGHLSEVQNIPVGYLTDHLDALPRNTPLVVHCQSGARSAMAASVLRARGFDNVINMTGGYAAWEAASLPTVHASQVAADAVVAS